MFVAIDWSRRVLGVAASVGGIQVCGDVGWMYSFKSEPNGLEGGVSRGETV